MMKRLNIFLLGMILVLLASSSYAGLWGESVHEHAAMENSGISDSWSASPSLSWHVSSENELSRVRYKVSNLIGFIDHKEINDDLLEDRAGMRDKVRKRADRGDLWKWYHHGEKHDHDRDDWKEKREHKDDKYPPPVVPEPASFILFISGSAVLAYRRFTWKRRQQVQR